MVKPILITSYVNPDLDGIAGAIGYGEFLQKMGKNVVVGIIGEPQEEARYVLDRFKIPYPRQIPNADAFDEVILLDASDLNGLEGKIAPEKVIELIDHRKVHEAHKFPNAKAQIELVGASAALVAEKFVQANLDISEESAILISAAIISNTLNFNGTVTTERDKKAFEWLNRVAKLPDDFWKELFTAKSDLSGPKLAERIKGDFALFVLGGKKVGIAQIEMLGATKMVAERSAEINALLRRIKADMNLEYIFLSVIALDETKNIFIVEDENTKNLFEKIFKIPFSGNIAERPNLIMRKQLVPILKNELD